MPVRSWPSLRGQPHRAQRWIVFALPEGPTASAAAVAINMVVLMPSCTGLRNTTEYQFLNHTVCHTSQCVRVSRCWCQGCGRSHGAGGHAGRAFGDQACRSGISKASTKPRGGAIPYAMFSIGQLRKRQLTSFKNTQDVAGTCGVWQAGTSVDEARVVGVEGDAGRLREARRQSLARQ